jgi:L-serine kinase (ADP)
MIKCDFTLSPNLILDVRCENINDLLLHEKVDTHRVNSLKDYLETLDQIIIPSIIVDKKTNLVIDGHHRVSVFKYLKIPKILVTKVDYLSSNIKLISSIKNLVKEEIIELALSSTLVPQKSTKHYIQDYNNKRWGPITLASKLWIIQNPSTSE